MLNSIRRCFFGCFGGNKVSPDYYKKDIFCIKTEIGEAVDKGNYSKAVDDINKLRGSFSLTKIEEIKKTALYFAAHNLEATKYFLETANWKYSLDYIFFDLSKEVSDFVGKASANSGFISTQQQKSSCFNKLFVPVLKVLGVVKNFFVTDSSLEKDLSSINRNFIESIEKKKYYEASLYLLRSKEIIYKSHIKKWGKSSEGTTVLNDEKLLIELKKLEKTLFGGLLDNYDAIKFLVEKRSLEFPIDLIKSVLSREIAEYLIRDKKINPFIVDEKKVKDIGDFSFFSKENIERLRKVFERSELYSRMACGRSQPIFLRKKDFGAIADKLSSLCGVLVTGVEITALKNELPDIFCSSIEEARTLSKFLEEKQLSYTYVGNKVSRKPVSRYETSSFLSFCTVLTDLLQEEFADCLI